MTLELTKDELKTIEHALDEKGLHCLADKLRAQSQGFGTELKCPVCQGPLRYVKGGDMFNLWCPWGGCKSRKAREGAIAGSLEFAWKLLCERVEAELTNEENGP